jgi:hypothetical protein
MVKMTATRRRRTTTTTMCLKLPDMKFYWRYFKNSPTGRARWKSVEHGQVGSGLDLTQTRRPLLWAGRAVDYTRPKRRGETVKSENFEVLTDSPVQFYERWRAC